MPPRSAIQVALPRLVRALVVDRASLAPAFAAEQGLAEAGGLIAASFACAIRMIHTGASSTADAPAMLCISAAMRILVVLVEFCNGAELASHLPELFGTLLEGPQCTLSSVATLLRRKLPHLLSVIVGKHGLGPPIHAVRMLCARNSAPTKDKSDQVSSVLVLLLAETWAPAVSKMADSDDRKAGMLAMARALCEPKLQPDIRQALGAGLDRVLAAALCAIVALLFDEDYSENDSASEADEAVLLAEAASLEGGVTFAQLHYSSTQAQIDAYDAFCEVLDAPTFVFEQLARTHGVSLLPFAQQHVNASHAQALHDAVCQASIAHAGDVSSCHG